MAVNAGLPRAYQNYENWSKLLKYYLDLGLINELQVSINLEEIQQETSI